MFKCLEYGKPIRIPISFFLIYPCLNFDMACWMSKEDMNILRTKSTISVEEIVRRKTRIDLQNPLHQDDAPKAVDILKNTEDRSTSFFARYARKELQQKSPKIHSGLSMTSRMTYFSDRILHPECKFYLISIARYGFDVPGWIACSPKY